MAYYAPPPGGSTGTQYVQYAPAGGWSTGTQYVQHAPAPQTPAAASYSAGNSTTQQSSSSIHVVLTSYVLPGIYAVCILALFVIGCVAVAGHLNGVVAGGCIIGLSIPPVIAIVVELIVRKVSGVNKSLHKIIKAIEIILKLGAIVMSALAVAHVVSPQIAGWSALVGGPISLALVCIASICIGRYLRTQEVIANQRQRDSLNGEKK
jgi:hypothetical protein